MREMVTEAWKNGLSDEEVNARLEAWGLEEAPENIERFKPRRGDTVHVQVRMDARVHRAIMVILGSQLDPSIETMSDVLHDSTARFLDDWNLRFADGPTARLLRWWTLERRKQQREARKHFLEMVDTEIDECLKERDERGLSSCLDNLYGEREDSMGYTPPKYLDQIDERIQKIQQGLK